MTMCGEVLLKEGSCIYLHLVQQSVILSKMSAIRGEIL